jgi:hypothetical protein
MNEIELILSAGLLFLSLVVLSLLKRVNKLKNEVSNLVNWADALEEWIEEGGDHYLGLDFDVDMLKAEIEEKVREELKIK